MGMFNLNDFGDVYSTPKKQSLFQKLMGLGTKNFGNSITFGQGASIIEKCWRMLLNMYIGGANTSYAVAGHKVGDQLPFLMKNGDLLRKQLWTWALGINDVRTAGYNNNPAPAELQYGVRTFLVQALLKTSVPASDPSIVSVGAWAAVSDATINAITKYVGQASLDLNSYKEFTFSGTNCFFSVVWQDNNVGSFGLLSWYRVYIDGVLQTTVSAFSTGGANSYYYNFSFYFKNLAPGNHTIRVVHYGDNGYVAARNLVITEFGTLKSAAEAAPAIVFPIYPFDMAVHAGGLTPIGLAAAQAKIADEVNSFKNEGYPVELVAFTRYKGVAEDTAEGLHPNDVGHQEIFEDVKDVSFLH